MREILQRRDRDPAAGSMPDDAGPSASLFGSCYLSAFCAVALRATAQNAETYETPDRAMNQPFLLGIRSSRSR